MCMYIWYIWKVDFSKKICEKIKILWKKIKLPSCYSQTNNFDWTMRKTNWIVSVFIILLLIHIICKILHINIECLYIKLIDIVEYFYIWYWLYHHDLKWVHFHTESDQIDSFHINSIVQPVHHTVVVHLYITITFFSHFVFIYINYNNYHV